MGSKTTTLLSNLIDQSYKAYWMQLQILRIKTRMHSHRRGGALAPQSGKIRSNQKFNRALYLTFRADSRICPFTFQSMLLLSRKTLNFAKIWSKYLVSMPLLASLILIYLFYLHPGLGISLPRT